jgi:hypothetical protein
MRIAAMVAENVQRQQTARRHGTPELLGWDE